jgi:hypothetical protein
MGWGKKTSGGSDESGSKPLAQKVALRRKIKELRRLEKAAFGPHHGRTDFYAYLKAVYTLCDWSDSTISRQTGRRVANLCQVKVRGGTTPVRIVIDATCSTQDRQAKSRWAQALEYAVAKNAPAFGFEQFLHKRGGVIGCANSMAALRKRNAALRPGKEKRSSQRHEKS